MTREETVKIIRAIKAFYPTFKPDDLTETINFWHFALDDQNYNMIARALKVYVRNNNTGFAPSPGQLLDCVTRMTEPEQLTDIQAWGLVMKAIRNSAYNSLEEFSKLPPVIQKAVGSPEQLRSMALDENFNESVEKSHFMKSYKVVQNREKELAKMPESVRKLVESVNVGSPKQMLEAHNAERVERLNSKNLLEEKEPEFVPMPEDAKKKLLKMLGISERKAF